MPQVHNRDLSVLVLEEFVALWRAETAAAAPPAPADPSQAVAPDEATAETPAGAPKTDADATADALESGGAVCFVLGDRQLLVSHLIPDRRYF